MPENSGTEELEQRIRELTEELDRCRASKQALADSAGNYRKIVENVSTGILVAQDGKVVFVNRGIEEVWGYPPEDLLNHPDPFEIIHPDDREMVLERHVKRLQGEQLPERYAYRILNKNGEVRWVEVTVMTIQWEGKPATLNFFLDITRRKQYEINLQQSEERYRSLVENTQDGYFIAEVASGKLLFLNRQAYDLFGYSADEIHELTIWQVIAPESHRTAKQRIAAWTQNPQSKLDSVVYKVLRKDGSSFNAEVSSSVVTFENRPVIQGTVRDITEKQSLQNQLQQAQRLESIGTLAGGVAHDFNNILMGIQGQASLMLMHTSHAHPFNQNLVDIKRYVDRAVDLTRQLLDFARGGKYEVKPTDLNRLLENSVRLFGRTKKEIEICLHTASDLWIVEADRRQIEQVLLNLYVNAWQAMPGGGRLCLQTENVVIGENYIKPFQVKPGPYIKISITDNGIGMDKTTQQKIFDPFFTTKEMGRGTGLGLASAYGIVKSHDGIINVYSEEGKGTTFCIYLPAAEGELIEEGRQALSVTKGEGALLLVDDEEFIVEIGKQMLQSLGYRVFVAENGDSAIEVYRQHRDRIQMVILDMIMPGLNGMRTFEALKRIDPEVKVLIASGYGINQDITAALDRGCRGFIQKPFDIGQLSQKVAEVLHE